MRPKVPPITSSDVNCWWVAGGGGVGKRGIWPGRQIILGLLTTYSRARTIRSSKLRTVDNADSSQAENTFNKTKDAWRDCNYLHSSACFGKILARAPAEKIMICALPIGTNWPANYGSWQFIRRQNILDAIVITAFYKKNRSRGCDFRTSKILVLMYWLYSS